jgi:hypothetical protein
MPVSRVQKTIASPLLIQIFYENPSLLAVMDILYIGEVGLAPLYNTKALLVQRTKAIHFLEKQGQKKC